MSLLTNLLVYLAPGSAENNGFIQGNQIQYFSEDTSIEHWADLINTDASHLDSGTGQFGLHFVEAEQSHIDPNLMLHGKSQLTMMHFYYRTNNKHFYSAAASNDSQFCQHGWLGTLKRVYGSVGTNGAQTNAYFFVDDRADTWANHLWTYDGQTIIMYKDGTQVSAQQTNAALELPSSVTLDPADTKFLIGRRGGLNLFSDGYLGVFAVWDRVLSSEEIAAIVSDPFAVLAEISPPDDPPSEDPPSEDPPSEDPPSEDPPSEDPPSEDPPSVTLTCEELMSILNGVDEIVMNITFKLNNGG